MTRKYDFITKLINGKSEASARTRWWPRHARAMERYMMLSTGVAVPEAKAVRELMLMGAKEWEVSMCRAASPGLMTEHAMLEIALIDSAMRKDVISMEQAGDRLFANARAQTEFYAARIENFPVKTFLKLLVDHCKLFSESAEHHLCLNQGKYDQCEAERQQNTLGLAAFTAEWL